MSQMIAFVLLGLGLVVLLACAVLDRRGRTPVWLGEGMTMNVVAPAIVTLWLFAAGFLMESVLVASDAAERTLAVAIAAGAVVTGVAISVAVMRWLVHPASEAANPAPTNVVAIRSPDTDQLARKAA